MITTRTGGTGEALQAALDPVVLDMSEDERRCLERRGREYAPAFDRVRVFDDLFRTPMQLLGRPGRSPRSGRISTRKPPASADPRDTA